MNDDKIPECNDPSCFCHDDIIAPPTEPEPRRWVVGEAPKIRPLRSVSVGFIAAALGFAGDFTKGPTPPRENHRKKSQAPFRRGGRG